MKHAVFKAALAAALLLSAVTAFAASGGNRTVQLVAGRADTVDLGSPVADVLVANPAIADVGTLRSDRLYLVGKTVGDTNVLAYDDAGNQLANISVHVRLDDHNLQETLKELFPEEQVSARTVGSNIVLTGAVSSPGAANQVRDVATRFLADKSQTLVDLMKVRGEQQVMLRVKVVEASREALRELGIRNDFRTSGQIDKSQTSYIPEAGGNPIGTAEDGTLKLFTPDTGRTQILPFATGMLAVGKLTTVINALEKHGIVNTLAEPNLTAISGETAGFLAGGEFPVPTGRDTQGNISIEFKQFGVSLNFTPTVINKDRIALQLSTEVSTQDAAKGVTLANVSVPGLSVRKAETTVELGSGGTIMIAGLIKSDTINSVNGLPGVQDLPIIGQLFKSKSFQRNESELLIIVTPYLVNPYAETEAVAAATPSGPAYLDSSGAGVKPGHPVAPVEAAPAPAPAAPPKTSAALSKSYLAQLRKTYGSRVPAQVAGGYIVE